mgnify:CR=1 FL=1
MHSLKEMLTLAILKLTLRLPFRTRDQHLGKEFYGDFGTFDVELTFAANYILDATGFLLNRDELLPKELRQKLDISNFKDKLCQQLSLGQKQRTAIVRALLQPFDWIFLDEPFSHLDKENKEKASQLIQQITKEENAGLIVTSLGEDHSFKNLELLQL